jgi:hypothetical protein
MLTAEELLVLQSHIPASIETQCGHNDGPSWNECVRLATDNPGCLFAGFLMPPARCDEGIDLDAVYVPLPDQDDVCAMEAMTRPDGRRHGPDEDGVENINGRKYRRLWWD